MMAAYVKRVKLELIPTAMSSPARPFEASKLAAPRLYRCRSATARCHSGLPRKRYLAGSEKVVAQKHLIS
jgi:hypothetical protein